MKKRRAVTGRLGLEELERRLVMSGIATSLSYNWAGYAITGNAGSVTSVMGTWIVPRVSGYGTAYSATWVGIDGWTSPTVQQIGTEADVVGGVPQYTAWYEMYPAYPVALSLKVTPGDSITAKVIFDFSSAGNNGTTSAFTLALTNNTTGQSFSTNQLMPNAQRTSAEWIEEAPSSNSGVLPLANFGKVSFSQASAQIGSSTGAVDNPDWQNNVNRVNMVNSRSVTDAATSGLTDAKTGAAGSSFSVQFMPMATTTPQRHRTRIGFFGPNQPDGANQSSLATVPFVPGLMNSSGQLLPTVQPATLAGTPTLAPTILIFPAKPELSLTPLRVDVPDQRLDAAATDDGKVAPTGVPLPAQPGAPANQLPPESNSGTIPNTLPKLPAGPSTPNPQEAAAAWHRASDACFIEGRWDETAQNQDRRAVIGGARAEDMAGEAAVGVLLTLGWGCYWSKAAEEGPRRKRWLSIN
jgi:hypothetical protein